MASTPTIDNSQMEFLTDQKMKDEYGVIYQERKKLTDFREEDGVKMCTLSHSRSIGDQTWTAQQKIVDGVVMDKTVTFTTMNMLLGIKYIIHSFMRKFVDGVVKDETATFTANQDRIGYEDMDDFNVDWEEYWHPMNSDYLDDFDTFTPLHMEFLTDHKMKIEGVIYQERNKLTDFREEDGVEMCTWSHSRSIGDQTWTAQQKIVDGVVMDKTVTFTTMNMLLGIKYIIHSFMRDGIEYDMADFNEDWEENWHPMNGDLYTGTSLYHYTGTGMIDLIEELFRLIIANR
jgi:hypothetical protein